MKFDIFLFFYYNKNWHIDIHHHFSNLSSRNSSCYRCSYSSEGQRCQSKMLPSSKFCYNHVTCDMEQQLFNNCSLKYENGTRCSQPAHPLSHRCHLHPTLHAETSYEKSFTLLQSAKQRCENRKRKIMERERLKGEPRVKRSSARLKECSSDTTPKTRMDNGGGKEDEDKTLMEIKKDRDYRRSGHYDNRGVDSSPTDGNIFNKGLFENEFGE